MASKSRKSRPQLQIRLFGTPQIEVDGTAVKLAERKATALLSYLAATRQRHSRDTLAALLWPDHAQSLVRLRHNLWVVRKGLGEEWLQVDRAQVSLIEGENVWVDVAQFHHLLNSTASHQHTTIETCGACVDRLEEAAALAQNDFLMGFSVRDSLAYAEWQAYEQESLRLHLASALKMLNRIYGRRHDYTRAIPYARRWVALDPLHEPAQRALIKQLAWSEQTAAALRQYETYLRLLAEELGATPEEETVALYRSIKGRKLNPPIAAEIRSLSGGAGQSRSLPAFLDQEREAADSAETAVFVARERELAELTVSLTSTQGGQGTIRFVMGGAGRGKTALIQAFARQAQAEDSELLVIAGHCNAQTGLGDPYLPFGEALTMLCGSVEDKWAAGLISREQALRLWEASRLTLPVLLHETPDLINNFVPAQTLRERIAMSESDSGDWLQALDAHLAADQQRTDQVGLFEQYTRLLKSVARHHTILVLIEDLHWVDASSSALLFHLSQELADGRVFIIGTYRPVDVTTGGRERPHPLTGIANELKRRYGDIWLDLSEQAPLNGRRFVDAYVDAVAVDLDESFRVAVFQHTEGYPLFTVELLRDFQTRGDIYQDGDGRWLARSDIEWQALPAKVEGVIEQRISRLGPDLQALLTVASIEGVSFTAEVAASVQTINEREVVRLLSRELDKNYHLVSAQALERLGTHRLSTYRFRHYLFQHYLYHSMDELERTYLHEAVGAALEALYEGHTERIAGQLARHFQAAGLLEKEITYLALAGDSAFRRHANPEAIVHYRRVLEIGERSPAMETQRLVHLHLNLGRALELTSQYREALDVYLQLRRMAEERDDAEMTLTALMEEAKIYSTMNPEQDPAKGLQLSQEALAAAESLGNREAAARIHWNLLLFHLYNDGNLEQAIVHGEQALSLARERAPDEALGHIMNDLSRAYVVAGQLSDATTTLQEAYAFWQQRDNRPALLEKHVSASQMYYICGQYQQALAESEAGYEVAQASGNVWGLPLSRYNIGATYLELGRPDLVIEIYEETAVICEQVGHYPMLIGAHVFLSRAYGMLGALEHAIAQSRQALKIAEAHFPTLRINPLLSLIRLCIRGGDVAAAIAYKQAIDDDPGPFANWVDYACPHRLMLGVLQVAQGQYEAAAAGMREAAAEFGEKNLKAFVPEVLLYEGMALTALGRPDQAWDRFSLARAEAEALGEHRVLWRILYALSTLAADKATEESLLEQARAEIKMIADHAPGVELSETFLNSPEVKVIWSAHPSSGTSNG